MRQAAGRAKCSSQDLKEWFSRLGYALGCRVLEAASAGMRRDIEAIRRIEALSGYARCV